MGRSQGIRLSGRWPRWAWTGPAAGSLKEAPLLNAQGRAWRARRHGTTPAEATGWQTAFEPPLPWAPRPRRRPCALPLSGPRGSEGLRSSLWARGWTGTGRGAGLRAGQRQRRTAASGGAAQWPGPPAAASPRTSQHPWPGASLGWLDLEMAVPVAFLLLLALGVSAAMAAPAPGGPVAEVSNIRFAEVTNETLRLEWTSSAADQQFSVGLENTNSTDDSQNQTTTSGSDRTCSVEFADLKPLTKYRLTVAHPEKEKVLATIETMTPPSLEMPEIEEVQEGCAHLTLAPLPEDQAKDVEAYLLLVRPLEDAKDYPAADIKDPNLKSKLEGLVKPPFYLAYEFTQEELSEESGGQVQIGSGAAKKDGKYGSLQDPKLTSGGNYRVAFVVIMKVNGEQTYFSEESCQMLIK